MKDLLRKVFWPILFIFERGETVPGYRPSHRKVLLGVGFLFFVLASVSGYFATIVEGWAALFPGIVFFVASLVSFVVALLGSDKAVAKIWGSR